MADKAVGLAAIGTTVPDSSVYDYAVLTPGTYTLVFGPVTLAIDFSEREVYVTAEVTDHEDSPAPVEEGSDHLVADVQRFKSRQRHYEHGDR